MSGDVIRQALEHPAALRAYKAGMGASEYEAFLTDGDRAALAALDALEQERDERVSREFATALADGSAHNLARAVAAEKETATLRAALRRLEAAQRLTLYGNHQSLLEVPLTQAVGKHIVSRAAMEELEAALARFSFEDSDA